MKLVYPAIFTPYEDGSSDHVVEFLDLPGCVTGSDAMAGAIFMSEDAASDWMLTESEDGKKALKASELSEVSTQPGQFVNMVTLDTDSYAAKYGSRSVKKTLAIPVWLNIFVEENHISCSTVLEQALGKRMQSIRKNSVAKG